MIALIQRVERASVTVADTVIGDIQYGMLVLLGVEAQDTDATVDKLVTKLLKFRMFNDDAGKMNRDITQVNGDILVVSQFTLVADTRKGHRPSFSKGAPPALGQHHYEAVIRQLRAYYSGVVATGQFGADMQVALVNDGPVTFTLHME